MPYILSIPPELVDQLPRYVPCVMSEGMMNNRSSVSSVVMYLAVAATLVGGIGVALTAVASSVVSHSPLRVPRHLSRYNWIARAK